jgi:hypothetical protein
MSSSSDDDNSPTKQVARTGDAHSPASSSESSTAEHVPAQSATKSSSEDEAKPGAAAYASSSDDDSGAVKQARAATLQQDIFGAEVSSSDEADSDSDDGRVNGQCDNVNTCCQTNLFRQISSNE